MATPSSNDPNKTSGSAGKAITSLSYPMNETLSTTCRLRFVEYSRDEPSSIGTDLTRAVITLPMPYSIPDSSNFAISSLDMGRWGAVDLGPLAGATGVKDAISKLTQAGIDVVKNEMSNFSSSNKTHALRAMAITNIFDSGQSIGIDSEKIRHLAGITENPHTTVNFEGVNLKSFTLTWRLSPRSQEESDVIRRIIETIKIRTHPKEALRRIALDYPDLVYVNFTGLPEDYLPRFHRSIVTNIMVNPVTGNGATFFKNGAPTEIELTLSFQEVRIVTRDLLLEEFGETE